MIFFRNKCFFCHGTKNLLFVDGAEIYSLYGTHRFFYHNECVCCVLSNPENHWRFVDRAILIADCIKEEKRRRDAMKEKCREIVNANNWKGCGDA